jgi:hypothetical protein
MVVRDDDLGAVHVIEHVTGNEFAAGVVAVGPLGWRTLNRSLIVKPGAEIRKPRVKYLLPWRRSALIVCQAMSMAMTVVLPAPVASFSASRISSGLASLLADARWSSRHLDSGATSVSQFAVSTASTRQKNGRTPLNL